MSGFNSICGSVKEHAVIPDLNQELLVQKQGF